MEVVEAAIWLRCLLGKLTSNLQVTVVHYDNQSDIHLREIQMFHIRYTLDYVGYEKTYNNLDKQNRIQWKYE